MLENNNVNSIKKDFSLMAILLIPVCVAINIVCGQLVEALKLPIYLDSIGTVLCAILAGPWVGATTGLLSNVINGIFDPSYLPYTIVSIVVGLIAGLMARKRWFVNPWKVAISGIIIGLASTVIGTPITAYVYGGVTGSGSTFLTGLLMATGQNLLSAVTTSVLLSNLVDKVLTAYIAYLIVEIIPVKHITKFSLGYNYMNKKAKKSHVMKDADL
jgi:energy-coupling factor transport system substrate-specific component